VAVATGAVQRVMDVLGSGALFGEGSLFVEADGIETARTLDYTRLQSWTRIEIEERIRHQPALGLSLLRYFSTRALELNERLETLAVERVPARVMLGVLQLAEKLGTPSEQGLRMGPLAHSIIAEYVGTSRELVTTELSKMKRAGLIYYSRKYIEVDLARARQALRRCEISSHATSNG
jgi:CRP/FNR family transcriptional regulator